MSCRPTSSATSTTRAGSAPSRSSRRSISRLCCSFSHSIEDSRMTATAQPAPDLTAAATSPKQQFADVFNRENATTRRVLNEIGQGYGDFRPNELCKSARELAHLFSVEQGRIAEALNNTWSWPPVF